MEIKIEKQLKTLKQVLNYRIARIPIMVENKDDIFQDLCLKLVKLNKEFENEYHMFNYMHKLVEGHIYSYLNKTKYIKQLDLTSRLDFDLPLHTNIQYKPFSGLVEEEEYVNDILLSIEKESPRMAFILRLLMDDYSWVDIAIQIGKIEEKQITRSAAFDWYQKNIIKFRKKIRK